MGCAESSVILPSSRMIKVVMVYSLNPIFSSCWGDPAAAKAPKQKTSSGITNSNTYRLETFYVNNKKKGEN